MPNHLIEVVDTETGVVRPTVGRIVHYVHPNADGVESPAIITLTYEAVVPSVSAYNHEHSEAEALAIYPQNVWEISLQVFGLQRVYAAHRVPHRTLDYFASLPEAHHQAVVEDSGSDGPTLPGTWHWPAGD